MEIIRTEKLMNKYSQIIVMSKNKAKIKFDTDLTQKARPSCSKTSARDKYSSGQTMQHTNRKLTKQISTRE